MGSKTGRMLLFSPCVCASRIDNFELNNILQQDSNNDTARLNCEVFQCFKSVSAYSFMIPQRQYAPGCHFKTKRLSQ